MFNLIRRIMMALTFTSEDQATLKELLAGGGKSAAAVKALQDENAAQQAALDAITQAVRDAKLDGNATTESNETTGRAQKAVEKRIARIAKHLGLPPLK
jgi:hypothetical protein